MNKFDVGHVQKILDAFQIQLLNIKMIRIDQQTRIYSANTEDNKLYTIRVIIKETVDEDIMYYIQSEIELLKQSDNMNIIHLIDHRESQEAIFLLQDYYLCTLTEIIQKYFPQKFIPLDLAIIILRQMVNGITYLHQNDIIHRDIKPDMISVVLNQQQQEQLQKGNINILNQALYKFNSLGFAKKVVQGRAGTIVGTELYMGNIYQHIAPEIEEEQEYGYEVDMYSLGVSMFFILTGKYPFQAFASKNQQSLLLEKKTENANFNLIQDIEMRQLIKQMVKYDPNERLKWLDLANHQYIRINNDGQAGRLDIQLNKNIQIYQSINDSTSSIQSKKESRMNISEMRMSNPNKSIQSIQSIQSKNDQQEQLYESCIRKRNHYVQIFNTNENLLKLQQMLQDTKITIQGVAQRFKIYIDYTTKIANLRVQECQKDLQQLKHESYDYLKEMIKKDLIKYQVNCDQQNFNLDQNQFKLSNTLIYKYILSVLYNAYHVDKTNKLTQLENPIVCLIYLCLFQIAKQTLIAQDLELEEDYKQQELWMQKYSQDPDHMAKNVTDVLNEYKIIY